MPCLHVAVAARVGCWGGFWAQAGGWGKEWGGTWALLTVNMKKPMGENLSGEAGRGSTVAVLAIGFVSCESYWGPAWSHLLGSTVRSSGMRMPDLQRPQACCPQK